jgi:hypothetical protein
MGKMEKEIKKEKKVRQYRSRQGRSDRQYQSNIKVMTYGCGLFLGILIVYGIVNTIVNVLG